MRGLPIANNSVDGFDCAMSSSDWFTTPHLGESGRLEIGFKLMSLTACTGRITVASQDNGFTSSLVIRARSRQVRLHCHLLDGKSV
jgi:hypothetical protein